MNDIIITDIDHFYGRTQCLHGLSAHLPAGGITAILGSSGCGKSTLLRCIAGHERINAGSIHLADTLLANQHLHLPPETRRIGMVFQDHALFPHLRVWQNVAFGLTWLRRSEQRQQATAWLERVGIAELGSRYPHQCSGGQQQRIALARALAPKPHALLLDEPFSGLDTHLRRSVRDEVLGLLRETGVTTVLVTHDATEAITCADHLLIIRQGRILQNGKPSAIVAAPHDDDIAALLAVETSPAGRRSKAG